MTKSTKKFISAENVSSKLNSNSLEGHQVLKLSTQLPNPELLRATINKMLRAFENVSQTELIKFAGKKSESVFIKGNYFNWETRLASLR